MLNYISIRTLGALGAFWLTTNLGLSDEVPAAQAPREERQAEEVGAKPESQAAVYPPCCEKAMSKGKNCRRACCKAAKAEGRSCATCLKKASKPKRTRKSRVKEPEATAYEAAPMDEK